jgi:hypothetical protein
MAFPFPHRPRHKYTAAEREQMLAEANGVCVLCKMPITPGQVWQAVHVDEPHVHGGDIVAPGHFRCHGIETAEVTLPLINRVKRKRRFHNGSFQTKAPMQGGKRSPLKRTIAGDVVPRVSTFARDRANRSDSPLINYGAPPIAARFIDDLSHPAGMPDSPGGPRA